MQPGIHTSLFVTALLNSSDFAATVLNLRWSDFADLSASCSATWGAVPIDLEAPIEDALLLILGMRVMGKRLRCKCLKTGYALRSFFGTFLTILCIFLPKHTPKHDF